MSTIQICIQFSYLDLPSTARHLAYSQAAITLAPSGKLAYASDMRQRILRDPLTGLYDSATFHELFIQLVKKANRYKQPLSLILCALDDIADFTEKHGESTSDHARRTVAGILERTVRDADVIGLWQTDVFALVLPETSPRAAKALAERVRRAMHTPRNEDPRLHALPTMSIGIASIELVRRRPAYLIESCEAAVAKARKDGGDTVCVWSDHSPQALQAWKSTEDRVHTLQAEVTALSNDMRQKFYDELCALTGDAPLYREHILPHAERVAEHSDRLAEALGWSESERARLRRAAFLHDIGLSTFGEQVLTKEEPLTTSEFDLFRRHPVLGVQILEKAGFFREELSTILHHHERFDGEGYPDHLSGRQIPAGARIVAIAEAWDRMTAPACYRQPMSESDALLELQTCAGTQFDAEYVTTFCALYS